MNRPERVHYRNAFEALAHGPMPRMRYPVKHWLWFVYWFGRRVGCVVANLRDTPLKVFRRGYYDGGVDDD
jgi:hypothetical protein